MEYEVKERQYEQFRELENSMNITLRQATEDDKEFLYILNRAAMHPVVIQQFGQWDEQWQRTHFDTHWNAAKYQIIEDTTTPIGTLAVTITADYLYLDTIQLLPEHQRQGIGSMLMQHLFDVAKQKVVPIHLDVLKANPARGWYEQLGFVRRGETATHIEMEKPV